jgi:hypothetical protein
MTHHALTNTSIRSAGAHPSTDQPALIGQEALGIQTIFCTTRWRASENVHDVAGTLATSWTPSHRDLIAISVNAAECSHRLVA